MLKPTSALKRFNHLSREIDAAYHEAARKLGLSDSAMLILYTLCSSGAACTSADICRLSGARKQTVHSSIRKLEDEGILYLECRGGKAKYICLTPKGLALTENTVARLIDIENQIFDAWPQSDREKYLELTQTYLYQFKQKSTEL